MCICGRVLVACGSWKSFAGSLQPFASVFWSFAGGLWSLELVCARLCSLLVLVIRCQLKKLFLVLL